MRQHIHRVKLGDKPGGQRDLSVEIPDHDIMKPVNFHLVGLKTNIFAQVTEGYTVDIHDETQGGKLVLRLVFGRCELTDCMDIRLVLNPEHLYPVKKDK